jgi:hypothetical protein
MVHDWGKDFDYWNWKIPLTPFTRGDAIFPLVKGVRGIFNGVHKLLP